MISLNSSLSIRVCIGPKWLILGGWNWFLSRAELIERAETEFIRANSEITRAKSAPFCPDQNRPIWAKSAFEKFGPKWPFSFGFENFGSFHFMLWCIVKSQMTLAKCHFDSKYVKMSLGKEITHQRVKAAICSPEESNWLHGIILTLSLNDPSELKRLHRGANCQMTLVKRTYPSKMSRWR